jgi:CheY-like chemotaxis protein
MGRAVRSGISGLWSGAADRVPDVARADPPTERTSDPRPADDATASPLPVGPATTELAPLVLVIEDYEDARQLYAEVLTWSGFRVEQADNGLVGVAEANRLLPDLILMDLALPGIDGWEATRRLKQAERTSAIPIVAVTGHVSSESIASALATGCDAYLTKPCRPDALVQEVRRLLARRRPVGRTLP